MKRNEFIPFWGLSIILAFLLMAGMFIILPNFTTHHKNRISPDKIRVLDAGPYAQVRRPSVNDAEVYLKKQFSNRQDSARQFNYVFKPGSEVYELAMFAPIIGGPASVSINGAPFARSEPQGFSAYGFGAAYVFTSIDARYFHPGSNRIDMILSEDPQRTGLRSLYIGDIQEIETLQKRYTAWITTLQKTGMLNGLIGFICSAMGALLGGHRTTMLGGLALSAIVLFHSMSSISFPLLDHPIASAGLIVMAVSLIFAGLKQSKVRNAVIINGVLITALVGSLTGLYIVLYPGYINHPITLSSFSLLSLYPVLIAGFPLILSSDIVSFREQARLAKAEARRKDDIIIDQGKALRREIEQKAVMEERQRFTRDMHDGIGGQLLSLLVRVRSGRVGLDGVETEIQSGINDLRLVVDSLDHVGDDLASALVTFQSRARAQFEAETIELKWTQDSAINSDQFGTRRVLNLYRFLQEAVSNILRHADAQNVHIQIYPVESSDLLGIIIEDDGKGISAAESHKAGKGLKNMQCRAKKLEGTLTFSVPDTGKGTRIELNIPLMGKS